MDGYDVCYPEGQAEACCEDGVPLDCGNGNSCTGMHPIVEGDNRFCMDGWCGCGLGMEGYDVCYKQDEADQCCDIDDLVCN
jgi:hypothetical protein